LARTISVATLILVGELDPGTPVSSAQEMADIIPDSVMVVIPDAGHMSNIESPEAFNQALVAFAETLPRD
jgi:3-oxoadipate enol-lactonase